MAPRPSLFTLDLNPSKPPTVPDPPLYTDPSPSSTTRRAPGNLSKSSGHGRLDADELHELRQKKAWEVAIAPAKQIPMQGFMLWMSGSGVQIFSMMTLYMLVKGAISGALNVVATFEPYEPPSEPVAPGAERPPKAYDLTPQKLAFVACQGGLLALAVYKINSMGLLPNKPSDWFMFEQRPPWAERLPLGGEGVVFR